MKIALMLDSAGPDATVADTFDEATHTLIREMEGDIPDAIRRNGTPGEAARFIVEQDCEAVVSGVYHNPVLFEELAGRGVTRYLGAGLAAEDALAAMDAGRLGLIPDYVGGTGCGGHDHGHRECGHEE